MSRVIVVGATGELGQRVCRLLEASSPELTLVRASARGRAQTLQVDVHEAPPQGLLGPGDVLIDAVGPYAHDPTAWVRRCAQVGAHWIDLSERAEFIARVREASQASPCAALSGCSTVPQLARALLRDPLMGEHAEPARVEILLSMGSRHRPSPGLMAGLLGPLGRPLPEQPMARAFGELTRRRLSAGELRWYGRFPCPQLELGCPARFWSGFDRAPLVWALRGLGALLGRVSPQRVAQACGPLARVAALWSPLGTWPGSLRLEREDALGRRWALELRAPQRGLDVPAMPAAWAATRLVGRPRSTARQLDELMSPHAMLQALRAAGLEVRLITP